ncbi:MAG TPA: 30S ribosome-binding factor RbfA [Candidatus Polarisedimenticolia bacterium]|jgi:ribosome-binding factor A|nr:30S ribosome-binding factor RbfA [Candidatus Polarisedimenticolia bacterium]
MTRKRSSGGPSQRQLRVGEALRHALAEILARGELRDPELAGLQVTVTEVRVSPDLRAATAFVVPFGGGDAAALAKALNRATGFFRMRLSDAVELRVAPTVHFAPDLSFDKADRIEKLLHDPSVIRDLKKDDPKDGNNGA